MKEVADDRDWGDWIDEEDDHEGLMCSCGRPVLHQHDGMICCGHEMCCPDKEA